MHVDLAWQALQWPGMEHVIVSLDGGGFRADSQLIVAETDARRVDYQLECDSAWRVIALTVTVSHATGERTLALSLEEDGRWCTDGRPLPELAGCVDVDISRSPLTNTLPIRRLSWSAGEARDLDVAYVRVPELAVTKVRQRYTMLRADPAVFRYESGSFQADLPVDGDGFVVDYPGLWRRVGRAT